MENNPRFLVNFIQYIQPMSTSVAEEIAAHFKPLSIVKSDILLTPEHICNELVILESGIARAFTYDVNGDEVTTNFFTPPTLAFDIASFFKRTRSNQTIHTLTNCKGWNISFQDVQTLFHSIPEFREFGRSNLVNCYAALQERTLSMINLTAEQRYVNLIQRQPEIFLHSPLKYISTYLGITNSSLSRIRKEFVYK